MNRIILAISLLVCLGVTAYSQEQTPPLLFRAAHCLAVKDFLPSSRSKTLTFGYFLDEESYRPEKELYLVQYAAPARSNGWAFAIWLTERDGHQNFNIQNNASFVLSKDDLDGVSFVSPPLGGTWTQEHLASAIKQIEKQPRFTIPVKDLYAANSSISCESYTDPQPKGK
jgi:hypothetical protein